MERGSSGRFRPPEALNDSFRKAQSGEAEKSVLTPYDRGREEMELDLGDEQESIELAQTPEAPRKRAA